MADSAVITCDIHPLLTKEIIDVLRKKRVFTIFELLEQDVQVLSKTTKLPFNLILTIRERILNKNAALGRNGFNTYNNILEHGAIISTNHPNLDSILAGGLYTGNIYELCSQSAQVYRQFIYKFIVDFLLKHHSNQTIMYYDTKYSFNPIQLKCICDKQLEFDKADFVLNNVLVGQVRNMQELFHGMCELKEQLEKKQVNVRIIIIDSLTAVFYSTIRIEKHNMILNSLINVLRLMAVQYQVCFLLTNLLAVDQEGPAEGCKVYGGKYWRSLPNIRVRIGEKQVDCNFECCVVKNNVGAVNQKCKITL